ncbi:hypothetical protein L8C07_03660 [Paenibacillus sp. CMAA1739]|uniref:hypothetical protein n=1 Tax=Paenibacillus ottowii TaxID=2315729 RepID=UPI0027317CD8|nr:MULTISPECIES: hypothetical protein [Paenibacillus]MDP1508848.1 hypothetical protein [Paenibacillus ottowii]MEC4565026.1 hypothetical protein [Paenibacillus sp. CMAA1739]
MEDIPVPSTCKGCERDIALSEEQITRILNNMRPKMECVNDEVYEARLLACAQCDELMSGHTCGISGSIVRIRALAATQNCPSYHGSRWQGPA